jgi:hypothetical protein
MAKRGTKKSLIDPALLDQLLAGQDPATVLTSQGLIGDLKKALAERMLQAGLLAISAALAFQRRAKNPLV